MRTMIVCFCLAWLCNLTVAQEKTTPKFTLLDWNVEAGGSDVPTILGQLKELEPFDVMGLSEVPVADAASSQVVGRRFISIGIRRRPIQTVVSLESASLREG